MRTGNDGRRLVGEENQALPAGREQPLAIRKVYARSPDMSLRSLPRLR